MLCCRKAEGQQEGTKENNLSADESDALMLAFLGLGKDCVKFHYEGSGRLDDKFWGEDGWH